MSRTKNLFRHFALFTNFTGSKIWPQFLTLVAFSRPSFETQQRICNIRNSEALTIILYFGHIWCSLAQGGRRCWSWYNRLVTAARSRIRHERINVWIFGGHNHSGIKALHVGTNVPLHCALDESNPCSVRLD